MSCVERDTKTQGKLDFIKSAAKDGKNILNCWFDRFFPFDYLTYRIAVLAGDVQSGGTDCDPIFKK